MRRLGYLLGIALATATLAPPAHADDWGVTRDPFDRKVIAQYKGILKRNPHDAGALANLLKMYRSFRTVDLLRDEYTKELEKSPDDWSTLVVLGHIYRKTGDDPRALELWSKAVAKKDDDAASWLAIGEIHKAGGKNKDARAAYDKALAHATAKDMKKKALRALADLALATGDTDAANTYFKQFLDLDPNNAQLWVERGDAMLAAGKREIALESYAAAEKLLGGDPQKRIEVVSRRGQALEGMGKDDEAVAEYRRAIKLAPAGYYVEIELTNRIIDIYRKKQALPQLLAQYEKEWPEGSRRHFEWSMLGKLYEETGQQDKAIAALKKAVAKSPSEIDTQRRLIQLLENSGKDDEALAQYEVVVRNAPGDARFQLELADRYQRRGQEKKALEVLSRLQVRFPSDPGVLSAIADLYQRWGKEELAIKQYELLAKLEPDDPQHLITLGEQYWQKQDKPKALATWKHLTDKGKASGFGKLGEVLGEHGIWTEAFANYAKAIKLDEKNAELYKGRAHVYEAHKDYTEAIADWEMVLKLVGNKATDRMARRDARKHYVAIITRFGAREQQYKKKWQDAWKDGAAGSDLESGYFLVEYFGRQGKQEKGQPEKVLEQVHKRVPEDQELTWDLVKAYRATRRFDDAVAVLLDLAKQQPSLETQVYNTIADIKIEQRCATCDADVEVWRAKAIAKSPRNPDGYLKLAEGFVAMQKFAEAMEAYEKVLQISPRDSRAMFALAQLRIQNNQADNVEARKAAELLRAVLRASTDENEVRRAGHEAIALEEMTSSLGELEKIMAPLAFMMAHKPVFRQVLVDLYVRYVPWLVEREKHGNDEVRKAAHAELVRIGGHGLQPLLEALRDDKDTSQQRVAVMVLGHLGNKGAAPALVHMARQEPPKDVRRIGTLIESPDREVRVDALVAAGRLGDAKVIDEVLPLMEHPDVPMREAATFALGRSGDRRAVPALVKALGDHRASVQTLACLGLAQIDDPRVPQILISTLADARKDDSTRAACAYAIGARRSTAGMQTLLAALVDNRGDAQRLAAWSLGQLGDAKALGPLVRAYFARAGRASDELVWAIGRVSGAGVQPGSLAGLDEYPLGHGKYNQEAAIAALPGFLPQVTVPAKLVTDHADDISKGLLDALGEHRDVVVSVLADLDGGTHQIALGSLSPTNPDAKLAQALTRIGEQIAPAVIQQLTSDDPKVRALAVSVLAKLDGGKVTGAEAAIGKALTDTADQVRASAMLAIPTLAKRRGGTAPTELVGALAKSLASAPWADRAVAAEALGKLGASGDPAALVKAAGDSSPFVRDAVATALGGVQVAGGLEALLKLSRDDVAQVRAAAAGALGYIHDDRATKRRAELAQDPEPIVRAAATAPR